MAAQRQILLMALVFACIQWETSAWGPLTHFDMGCKAVAGASDSSDVLSCITSNPEAAGAMDLPDAFFFPPHMDQGGSCSAMLSKFHNPVFAGYTVLLANDTAQLQWATSFGSHSISDNGGFLTSYLSEPGTITWLSVWQFMSALDSYVADEWRKSSGASEDVVESAIRAALLPITTENAQFLSDAAAYYQTIDPTFPTATVEEIVTCSTEWVPSILPITLQASRSGQQCYEEAITFYDSFTHNTTFTWTEASERFLAYRQCGQDAVTVWLDALLSGASPEKAFAQSAAFCLDCQA